VFVSQFFVQTRLSNFIVHCLLQPGVGCVGFLADWQYFPLKLTMYPHFQVFWLSAFDASASNRDLMDMRRGKKI